VQIQGPRSKEVMRDLFGESVLDIPYYYLGHFTLDGMEVVVSRTGYSAETGYEIYLKEARQNAVALWNRVIEAGERYEITAIGPNHIRRIEGGMLSYGADMTLDTNPFEVGLGWMVNLRQEADFIGKEALRAVKERGVERRLVGVEIDGPPVGSYVDGSMTDYWPVFDDGSRIGNVTSACYSPRLDRNIGYATVPVRYGEIGTELKVLAVTGEQRARVVEKPFIDPRKELPKA
jgi:glycine cleavage system aminomethyltransferase T